MTWIISVVIAVEIFMIIGLMLANDNFFLYLWNYIYHSYFNICCTYYFLN